MRLIDADTAQPGLTIVSAHQAEGKGQRGRMWQAQPGESLLMSLISTPNFGLEQQFTFSATVAVAIAKTLQKLNEDWNVAIKWPNDIIINDKKAGGVLIENVIRGQKWSYAIIGFGLNVRQRAFPAELPTATSLYVASGGIWYSVNELRDVLRKTILEDISSPANTECVLQAYNEWLYKKGAAQAFVQNDSSWEAVISQANADGTLQVILPGGETAAYVHGAVNWKW